MPTSYTCIAVLQQKPRVNYFICQLYRELSSYLSMSLNKVWMSVRRGR